MTQSCPISFQRVDENCVRLIASQVAIVGLLFMITLHPFFLILLIIDFFIRLHNISPFIFVAMKIINGLKIKPKPTNEKPKRFALYLGLLTTFLIAFFTFLGFMNAVIFFTGFLVLASFLEASRSYCIGCKIYYVLQIFKLAK